MEHAVWKPNAHVVEAIVLVPQVEGIATRYLSATLRRLPLPIRNLADVDAKQTVTERLALVDLVLHPSTATSVLTYEHDGDVRSCELTIDPPLNGSITLLLDLLEIGSVNESSRFPSHYHTQLLRTITARPTSLYLKLKNTPRAITYSL